MRQYELQKRRHLVKIIEKILLSTKKSLPLIMELPLMAEKIFVMDILIIPMQKKAECKD